MAVPRDWTTMPMNDPGLIWQQRPGSLNVYITPREELSPANRFLARSAFIFAGLGRNDPYLKRRIAECMGRHFHCDSTEFVVFTIHEDFGDVLRIFPNEDMARVAIDRATFYIGNNTEIALHPYSPQLQMAFGPLGGRARIHLYGLPLQHWNRFDMCSLVSGFGYPLRVAPYFNNGNYEYLTMFVACKKPSMCVMCRSQCETVKHHVHHLEGEVRKDLQGRHENHGEFSGTNSGTMELYSLIRRGRRDRIGKGYCC